MTQTLEYPAEPPKVHLVGAVEHHYILAESLTHVLDRLSLTSSGRASGRTPQGHA